MTDRPAPDPAKLLEDWMAFENGEEEPGRVLANLKKGGLRDVLEQLAATHASTEPAPAATPAAQADTGATA